MGKVMASTVFKSALLLATTVLLWTCAGEKPNEFEQTLREISFEKIASVSCSYSSYWGPHAAKIARNEAGIVWSIGLDGAYPNPTSILFRRNKAGQWEQGQEFPETYQPSLLVLDSQGRLNVFTNSVTNPQRHYRSLDDNNFDNFELVAEGNGHSWDPHSYYTGVGIHNDMLYMSYITNDADAWLTWKALADTAWAPAVLLFDGYADPGGNHGVVYPNFAFHEDSAYVVASHTSDGSTYNFKDAVFLYTFPLDNPADFDLEQVYPIHKGYPAFGYEINLDDPQNPELLFAVREKVYGEDNPDALPPSIYMATREKGKAGWVWQAVSKQFGVATRGELAGKSVIVLNENDWKGNGKFTALERGKNSDEWTPYPIPWAVDSTKLFPSNLQLLSKSNGSTHSGLNGIFDVRNGEKGADSLYIHELYYLHLAD
jgi:hypothetical protein